jgi:hypothetical protein
VLLEAIRACFGALPPPPKPLFAPWVPPAEDPKERRMRTRAWALLTADAQRPTVHVPGLQACAHPPSEIAPLPHVLCMPMPAALAALPKKTRHLMQASPFAVCSASLSQAPVIKAKHTTRKRLTAALPALAPRSPRLMLTAALPAHMRRRRRARRCWARWA